MQFTQLLHQREALLRQARLANLAFAYARLSGYADRVAQAGLRGAATIHETDPAADRFWPTLTADAAAQSVIDEHFLDEDVAELEEIFRFLQAEGIEVELTFDFAVLARRLLPVLHRELTRAGVTLAALPGCSSGAVSDQNADR